jgi:hypothetical protein
MVSFGSRWIAATEATSVSSLTWFRASRASSRRRQYPSLEALGGSSSAAGSCVWHVVGLQRSVRELGVRQGWGGRLVRPEQAQGMLIAALGMLAVHFGSGEGRLAS